MINATDPSKASAAANDATAAAATMANDMHEVLLMHSETKTS
jgi:hypothetical protein